jgi:hypothetical protein
MEFVTAGINVIDSSAIPFFLTNIFDSPNRIEIIARVE